MATEHNTAALPKNHNPALSESRRVAAELDKLIGPAAAGDRFAMRIEGLGGCSIAFAD